MKKLIPTLMTVVLFSSCSALSNVNWNTDAINSAVGKAATAASITDAQIIELCRQSVAQLDAENTIETGKYNQRLQKLVSNVSVPGLTLNFKVYKKDEINAFACGDGSGDGLAAGDGGDGDGTGAVGGLGHAGLASGHEGGEIG